MTESKISRRDFLKGASTFVGLGLMSDLTGNFLKESPSKLGEQCGVFGELPVEKADIGLVMGANMRDSVDFYGKDVASRLDSTVRRHIDDLAKAKVSQDFNIDIEVLTLVGDGTAANKEVSIPFVVLTDKYGTNYRMSVWKISEAGTMIRAPKPDDFLDQNSYFAVVPMGKLSVLGGAATVAPITNNKMLETTFYLMQGSNEWRFNPLMFPDLGNATTVPLRGDSSKSSFLALS